MTKGKQFVKGFLIGIAMVMVIGLLSTALASAQIENAGDFERGENITLLQSCSNCSFINITSIQLGNKTNVTFNEPMIKDGTVFYFELDSSYTQSLGRYDVFCVGDPEGIITSDECSFSFYITNTGRDFDTGESLGAIGVLGTSLVLAFLFMLLGFKLGIEPKLLPLSFFFIIVSIGLGVYSLHLSYVFTNDIIEYESLTPITSIIYTSILWMLTGLIIISVVLMLFAFIKELAKVIETHKMGEDWNPISGTYE